MSLFLNQLTKEGYAVGNNMVNISTDPARIRESLVNTRLPFSNDQLTWLSEKGSAWLRKVLAPILKAP